MTQTLRWLSPQSSAGSLLYSILGHLLLAGAVVFALGLNLGPKEVPQDYIDLGYEVFDEPPAPAKQVHKVAHSAEPQAPVDPKVKPDNSPKELQDERGVVAGTQAAAKSNNIGSDNNGNANATPYYKIKPKYPKAALVSGTEGWVMMKIDINENGEVENIRVVDGEQRNLFQTEARRAVEKWKYRPFLGQDGKPFKKTDHLVRVDFKLQDATAQM